MMCGEGSGWMAEDLAVLHACMPLPLKDHKGDGYLGASGPDFNWLMENLEIGPGI